MEKQIIKSCMQFPSVEDKHSPECGNLFGNDIILVRKIARGAFGIVYEIKTIDPEGRFALKINNLNTNTINELKVDCLVDEIRNIYTDSVVGINRWFLCNKPPSSWHLIEIPTVLKSAWEYDKTLLYFIMNLAEISLDKLDVALDEYDIACILFELLYALILLRYKFNLSHNDIKTDNILFSIATYGRKYHILGKEYYIKSPYLPMLSDFGMANTGSGFSDDVQNLFVSITDYANQHVELSENFVEGIQKVSEIFSIDPYSISGLSNKFFSERLMSSKNGKPFKSLKEFQSIK